MSTVTTPEADLRGHAPESALELGDFTTDRRVLRISAIAIGIGTVAAFVAWALLALIAFFTNLFFFQRLSLTPASPADHHLGALVVLVPVIGGLVIGVMARYGSDRIRGHGIPEAIEAILLRGSRVEPLVAVLKPVSSAISIGSGGPFGAEGPIIMTGGAVGSLIAQAIRLTAAERKTLLVAGAAAGMSATFGTPVAAVLLAVELLLFEWKPRSAIPVALASAAAAVVRPYLLGSGALFPTGPHQVLVTPEIAVCCLGVGVAAGLLSGALTAAVYAAEDTFQRLPIHWMWWPAIGGLAIGLGGLVEPRALGVGYDNIADLLSGKLVGEALLALVVVKATIWAVSLGSGTSGGVLAPLLTLGAALGGLEAGILPAEGVGFWPLVSMGAILGGTMRVPFTAVIFALELSHDLDAILPLMIAVAGAFAFTVLALPRSILTEKIARRGFHVSREYAIDPLEILFVREVMGVRLFVLPPEVGAADALAGLQHESADERRFPLVDANGRFLGVIGRADLDRAARETPTRPVLDLRKDTPFAYEDEPLRLVVYKMAEHNVVWLPVVDRANPTKLVGRVTLEDLLQARSRHLEDERRRERSLQLRAIVPSWLRRPAKAG